MLRDDYKRNPLTWYQPPKIRKKDKEKQFCIIDEPNQEKQEAKKQIQTNETNQKPYEYEYYQEPEESNYQYCFPPPAIVDELKQSTKFFSMPDKKPRRRQTKPAPQVQMTVQNCYNSLLVQQQLADEKNKHKNDLTLEQIFNNLEAGTPLKTQEHKERMQKNFQVQKDFQDKLAQYKESRKFNLNLKEKHACYCFPFKPSFTIPMREVSLIDQYYDDEEDDIYANVPKKYSKPIQKDKNRDYGVKKVKQKPQGHQWKCLACGYINSGFSRNCEICNSVQFY